MPHRHYTLGIPKMLRPYFRFNRDHLKELCRIARDCLVDYQRNKAVAAERAGAVYTKEGVIAVLAAEPANLDKNPAFKYTFHHEIALQNDLQGRVPPIA